MSDDEAISAVLPTDDSDTSIGNVQGLEESNEENVNQTIAFNENVFPLGLSSYPLLPVSRLCKLTPGVNKISKEAVMLVAQAAGAFTSVLARLTFQWAEASTNYFHDQPGYRFLTVDHFLDAIKAQHARFAFLTSQPVLRFLLGASSEKQPPSGPVICNPSPVVPDDSSRTTPCEKPPEDGALRLKPAVTKAPKKQRTKAKGLQTRYATLDQFVQRIS